MIIPAHHPQLPAERRGGRPAPDVPAAALDALEFGAFQWRATALFSLAQCGFCAWVLLPVFTDPILLASTPLTEDQLPWCTTAFFGGWAFLTPLLSRGADGRWAMAWDRETVLTSQHSEAGRGMELSELVKWHGRLYTMDDRSGIVFELYSKGSAGSGAGKLVSVPRWILMEGDGNAAKGQKTEWATVKDDVLYTGSFGKEYVGADGGITSLNNLWVSTVDAQGTISHEDWTDEYNAMRKETNSLYPGYMIIETILWSPIKRKWFVLPRRVSSEPYDEVADEKRGDNIVIVANEDFTEVTSFRVGVKTPERAAEIGKVADAVVVGDAGRGRPRRDLRTRRAPPQVPHVQGKGKSKGAAAAAVRPAAVHQAPEALDREGEGGQGRDQRPAARHFRGLASGCGRQEAHLTA